MYVADKDIHKGHRSRMRSKLELHGPRIFDTYELLEMLLYYAVPYRDTNPIAKRLLARFGSLDGVLRASASELSEVDGIGERCAELIRLAGSTIHDGDSMASGREVSLFDNYHTVGEFLVSHFREKGSSICIMLLDNGMRLIDVRDIYGIRFDSAGVRPKFFMDAALSAGATVAIIAHSRKYGAMVPTEGERATQKLIFGELSTVGVTVAEHYLISSDRYEGVLSRSAFKISSPNPWLQRFLESVPDGADEPFAADEYSSYLPLHCPVVQTPLARLLSYAMDKEKAAGVAAVLFGRYGSIQTILSEGAAELCDAGGLTMSAALLIKLTGYVNSRRVTDNFKLGVTHTDVEVRELIRATFLGLSEETVFLLLFDEKDRVIGCEYIGEGTVSASDVYPRKLVERAVKKKASGVIMMHNHPKGAATPSGDDVNATNRLGGIFLMAGIRLKAHYIAADGELSRIEPAMFI